MLAIRASHTDRTVVVTETGNIYCGGSSISLDDTKKYVLFLYDGTLSKWVVVGGTASVPGSDTQVIFNNAGALGADAGMTYTLATDTLTTNLTLPDAGKITLNPSIAVDHTAQGLIITATAGEAVSFGEDCYLKSDNKMWKADADSATTMASKFMAIATIGANAAGLFLKWGYARDDSAWAGMTVGADIYASQTAGALTQTAPLPTVSATVQVQPVGHAPSTNTATVGIIWYDPQPIVFECGVDVIDYAAADGAITPSLLSAIPIQYLGNHSSTQTFTLGALAAADVGKTFDVVKTGTGAGVLRLQLPASTYAYSAAAASTEAGYVELAVSARGSMRWRVTSATTIQLVCADGSLAFSS
jgi:hypothetical protein